MEARFDSSLDEPLDRAKRDTLLAAERADVRDYILNLIVFKRGTPWWHQGGFADRGSAILDHFEQIII
jgi:hypothetical protein